MDSFKYGNVSSAEEEKEEKEFIRELDDALGFKPTPLTWQWTESSYRVKQRRKGRRDHEHSKRKSEEIEISKHLRDAKIPKRATSGSVGYDLTAATELFLNPGESGIVRFGLLIKFPSNKYFAEIHSRSGLCWKKRIEVAGGPGIIDSDFEGLIAACMVNHGNEGYKIECGERIAQLVFRKRAKVDLVTPYYRKETKGKEEHHEEKPKFQKRGKYGFGSTGQF